MTKPKTHQILIIFGLLSLGIAAFLPLGYTIIYPHQFNDIEDYIVLPKFGIASGAYYLNFILLAIPFICGYHGKGISAQIFTVLFGIVAFISTSVLCTLIGFTWGGPIQGNSGSGMTIILLGDVLIVAGCLFQISNNKKLSEG